MIFQASALARFGKNDRVDVGHACRKGIVPNSPPGSRAAMEQHCGQMR